MKLFATLRHIKRLGELEERVETLERQVQSLDQEWSDYYDKLRTTMQRIVKRAERVDKAEERANGESQAPLDFSDPRTTGWTATQRQAQSEIMRRRAGMTK